MITNALENKKIPVYGDGLNVRDWIYVLDHCKALDVVLHKGRNGEVYNIGGKSEMKNIDVVKLVLKEMNKPESLIEFVKDRPGHDRRYAIDSTKIEKEMDWRCEHDFGEWIRETLKWYINSRDWWLNIKNGDYMEYYSRQYVER
jgi:dTDP-glucose 4,6-dehydratase